MLLRRGLWGFFLVGVAVLAVFAVWRWEAEAERMRENLAAQAGFAAMSSHTLFQDISRGLGFLVNRQIAPAGECADTSRLRLLLHDFVGAFPDLSSVRAYGPDGNVLAKAASGEAPPEVALSALQRVGRLTGLRDAREAVDIGRNVPCRDEAGWCIPIRRLIDRPNGQGSLVLEALLPVRAISARWQGLELPGGASVGLLRNDHLHQARWPVPHPEHTYRKAAAGPLVAELQAHPERAAGFFRGRVHSDGSRRIGAYNRIAGLPMTTYVARPATALWRVWWGNNWPVFLSFGLYLGFLGGLSHVITGRERRHSQELRELSRVDAMSGLANRLGFEEALNEAVARTRRRQGSLAVLNVDLDGFREINDRFGHDGGDVVIRALAERLDGTTRSGDLVARRGADEFTILAWDVDGEGAADLAQRILERVHEPLVVAGQSVSLSASLGIALFPDNAGEAAMDLQQQADSAMQAVKADGGGTYRFYAREMGEAIQQRLRLKQEVVRAWEEDEFEVFFQPLYRLADYRLVGAETLLRWRDPGEGLRSPAEFIPVAEETGLIVTLGEWALRQAGWQLQGWRRDSGKDLSLSVNVSPRQFYDPALVANVRRVLADTGVDPANLTLEITESLAMSEEHGALETLHALKRLGVRIAIDDFGTGYSSLSYLEALPVDVLKIDRSFVSRLDQPQTRSVVTAILQLADTLGLTCLAEGIETAEQETTLAGLGCELGQGFFYGPPLPADEFRDVFL